MRELIDDSGKMDLLEGNWCRYIIIYHQHKKVERFIRYDIAKYNNELIMEKTIYNHTKTETTIRKEPGLQSRRGEQNK